MKGQTPKACPFCGGLKISFESKAGTEHINLKTRRWEKRHTGSLRCNKCHARGPTVSARVPAGTAAPLEQLEDMATEAWNNRK